MIRQYLFKPIFDLAIRLLDTSVPPEKFRDYLAAHLTTAVNSLNRSPRSFSNLAHLRLLQAVELSRQLGADLPHVTAPPPRPPTQPTPAMIQAWHAKLPDQRVLTSQDLPPGADTKLLYILDLYTDQYTPFLAANLEKLLLHVEVKRQDCFAAGHLTAEEHWLQRHNISILFSRYTQHSNDFRFLNAALKLNDWAFPSHHRLEPNLHSITYALAIAEAELTLQEMLH